jgi:aminomethyltransferase
MLAVQGPASRGTVAKLLSPADAATALSLEPFHGLPIGQWFIGRTGYTGEDGFEIMLDASDAPRVWKELNALGVTSCGLGARDTLRLEAGMNLYGNDMDENTHPLESGLAWTVAFEPRERKFIGREALEAVKARGNYGRLVGLVLEDRGVLRPHQKVIVQRATGAAAEQTGAALGASAIGGSNAERIAASPADGEITSGTFSPTLQRSIAFARVPAGTAGTVQVDIRGKLLNARVVRPPFVRNGQSLIDAERETRKS